MTLADPVGAAALPGGGPPGADASPAASLKTYRPLQAILIGLTFVTGIVDAITYLDLGHVFAANMTGNVALLGFALVGASQTSVSASLVALAAFLVGAALGGRVARELEPQPHRWVVMSLGIEGVLLAAAVLAATFRAAVGDNAIVGLLALAMGLRTAGVRRMAIPDLTTTVLTQTLTGLAADTQLPGGGPGRQGRRLATVAAMLLGAAAGALLLRGSGVVLAIGAAVALVLLGAVAYVATVRNTRPLPRPAEAVTSHP